MITKEKEQERREIEDIFRLRMQHTTIPFWLRGAKIQGEDRIRVMIRKQIRLKKRWKAIAEQLELESIMI